MLHNEKIEADVSEYCSDLLMWQLQSGCKLNRRERTAINIADRAGRLEGEKRKTEFRKALQFVPPLFYRGAHC